MKNTNRTLIAGLLLMFFLHPVFGQNNSNDERLKQAHTLLNEYRDASFFRDMNTGGFDPSWEGIFRNCFAKEVQRIIFDIPFRTQTQYQHTETQIVKIYQDLVTIDEYIETIRSAFDQYNISDFSYGFTETGFDTTNLYTTNRLRFEIRKTFSDTSWSINTSGNYIIEMRFIDGQAKITAIRAADENTSRSNVSLTFVNASLKQNDRDYPLAGIAGRIGIEFDDNISNHKIIILTDFSGKTDLGLVPNSATLKIDTVIDFGRNKYSVPNEWRLTGKKVITQPVQGFIVPLRPWKWNGFSWSVRGFGGAISQSENGVTNFSSETSFENKTGYKFGLGVEMVKLFSVSQIMGLFSYGRKDKDPDKLASRRTTYLGVGLGISFYQLQYKISGDGFVQDPYPYSDRLGTPVQVLVSGSDYLETIVSNGLVLPVFAEIRKTLPRKSQYLQAFSMQAGINLIIPFRTEYEITGDFSRHGLYEQFNPQPVTNDEFYNYYSHSKLNIQDTYQNNQLSPALMFRFNGFFNVFGNKTDNLLDIGLLLAFPFRTASTSKTDSYFLAAGNDDFSSMSNSKNKIYDYFIGLSLGYNFINYRVY